MGMSVGSVPSSGLVGDAAGWVTCVGVGVSVDASGIGTTLGLSDG